VEDDGRILLIPDRRGNNRLDGLKNIVEDPRVALIFFIPGANETYRVNGRARISADPLLRRRFAVEAGDCRCGRGRAGVSALPQGARALRPLARRRRRTA
jgi:uncharacterized protein